MNLCDSITNIPPYVWTKNLSDKEPSRSVHTFSRPPVLEALGLLNVAARVSMYISGIFLIIPLDDHIISII